MRYRIVIGSFIIFLASIGGTIIYINNVYSYFKIKNWPTVNGEITSINIRGRQYESMGKLKTNYYPRVTYKYVIDEEIFFGKNANCFDEGNGTDDYANEYISPYREGMAVTVYYNDKHPSESCLNRDFNKRTKRTVVFPIIFLCLSIIVTYKIHERKKTMR